MSCSFPVLSEDIRIYHSEKMAVELLFIALLYFNAPPFILDAKGFVLHKIPRKARATMKNKSLVKLVTPLKRTRCLTGWTNLQE